MLATTVSRFKALLLLLTAKFNFYLFHDCVLIKAEKQDGHHRLHSSVHLVLLLITAAKRNAMCCVTAEMGCNHSGADLYPYRSSPLREHQCMPIASFTHAKVGTVWAEHASMIYELSRHLTDFDYMAFFNMNRKHGI